MIKERIIKALEFKGIAKEKFYKKIGMTSASFRGKAKNTPLNSTAIENILSEIPDINLEWLLTGEGDMFVSPGETTSLAVTGEGDNEYSVGAEDDDMKVKIIIEVAGETKEKVIQLLSGNADLSFLKK